jgi:hypothetical protein
MSASCLRCGPPLARGAKSCSRCGAPVAKARRQGFGIWWIIIPTLIYAYLSRDVITTLVLAALGACLAFAQSRKEIPARVRPYLPLLQLLLVFIFLGGSPIAVLLVAACAVAVIWQSRPLIRILEPWWQVQQQIPSLVRRVAGFLLAVMIGYGFGMQAGGSEWTSTFLSIACGTAVVFLLSFTPPAALRKQGARKPA